MIGGGPAGSACALTIARAGYPVTIVERAQFPRRKVCGEYLNSGALVALDELDVLERVRAAATPLRGVRLVPPGTPPIELPFPAGALALERATLDALLLEAALATGATLVRARAEELTFEAGRVAGVVVRDAAGERRTLRSRHLIGADGSGSLVARKLGLVAQSRGARRFALGGHYGGFGDLDAHVEMYVGAGAYFAINPLAAERANVMVVVRDRDLAAWSGAVDVGMRGKAAELGRGHRSFAGATRLGPPVSIGPLAFDVRAVTRPGALLAGDAAGPLNPFTGQGVFLALRSGMEAGRAVALSQAERAAEGRHFAAYAAWRQSDFAARRRLAQAVGVLIDVPFLARRAANKLRRLPELGETLLAALGGSLAPARALDLGTLGRLLI